MSEFDLADDQEPVDDHAETRSSAVDRRGLLADPVVRRIVYASFGILILWLAGILSALVFGLISPSGAPRTAVERALRSYEVLIEQGNTDARVWGEYISSLIETEQYIKAGRMIDQGMEVVAEGKSEIILQQSLLALARGDAEAAIQYADEARAQAETEREELAKQYTEIGVTKKAELPEQYYRSMLAKAEALLLKGDRAAAIVEYDSYLEAKPTAANVYVLRGDLKAAEGDPEGAEADYRSALTYIPDYAEALSGLEKIGAER